MATQPNAPTHPAVVTLSLAPNYGASISNPVAHDSRFPPAGYQDKALPTLLLEGWSIVSVTASANIAVFVLAPPVIIRRNPGAKATKNDRSKR
jgi:hypothetical protein